MSFFSKCFDYCKKGFQQVKQIAGKALIAISEFGEKAIKTVKDVWPKVKPYIEVVKVSAVIGKNIPVISDIAGKVDSVISILLSLENSPILHFVDKSLQATFSFAKITGKMLTASENEKLSKLKEATKNIGDELNNTDDRVKDFIKNFFYLKLNVATKIKQDKIENMQHYLQLRASQKIMDHLEDKIKAGLKPEGIKDNDLFILKVANKLISENPVLDEKEISRINEIINQIFVKDLLPLVFEEMVKFWSADLNLENAEYETQLKEQSKKEATVRRLKRIRDNGLELEVEDKNDLSILPKEIAAMEDKRVRTYDRIMRRRIFIDASEGLLRALENSIEEVIEQNDIIYVKEDIPELSEILIDCMENGREWEELTVEQQLMVTDFANMFRNACEERGNNLIEIEVK